ncbi:MAG: DEAD/DEAH box helicase, partial [Bacteriovorax sp.]
MYLLRDYQIDSVQLTIKHFQKENTPALIVLPTGAGKSLVIAELAKIAKGRVLVLAHVKELVEQNHAKYESYGLHAGIFSAGLNRKDVGDKVIFGSIQSVANAGGDFFSEFTLLIIDECHRVSMDAGDSSGASQYQQVIERLRKSNSKICILGLTATPYRLGTGYIYEYNAFTKKIKSKRERFFKKCIFELSIGHMIKNKFLTPPIKIDSPVACYDFESLKMRDHRFVISDIEALLKDQKRITPVIIQNILDMSEDRRGVMIFTSTVRHAQEILSYLPKGESALVVGDTEDDSRDFIINEFKKKKLKYLVNVSVLTTGFDAPHVDVIAILRPTESVSLYQQIVGRGLRLSEGKTDCLILDYTGLGHNIFCPEIDDERPNKESQVVKVLCPLCGGENFFYGLVDSDGDIVEHYGRKCQSGFEDPNTLEIEPCPYRFRFKQCDQCGEENDIAARVCQKCEHVLVDTDKKLKEAMALKDAHVMRVDSMQFIKGADSKYNERLEVHY